MKPGETTSPAASIVERPVRAELEIARTLPAVIPILRTASSFDSGSMTRPPRMTTSYVWAWPAAHNNSNGRMRIGCHSTMRGVVLKLLPVLLAGATFAPAQDALDVLRKTAETYKSAQGVALE